MKCPQTNEAGQPYWSYSLIRDVAAGDIVFHYSTREQAFVAARPLRERRLKREPLFGCRTERRDALLEANRALAGGYHSTGAERLRAVSSSRELRTPENESWIAAWVQRTKALSAPAALRFQSYPTGLRAAHGYLTKMPREFVDRWPQLDSLADQLEPLQEVLDPLRLARPSEGSRPLEFRPKSDAPYLAVVAPGEQRRTRKHERLVHRGWRMYLQAKRCAGCDVTASH